MQNFIKKRDMIAIKKAKHGVIDKYNGTLKLQ